MSGEKVLPKQPFRVSTCKFCNGPAWFGIDDHRFYDPGGLVFHVESCPRRRAHHKHQAAVVAEARRRRRMEAEADSRDEAQRAREAMERRRERASFRNR